MCGIAGYITKGKTDHRHAVATAVLAVHMETRGAHSWGVMTDTDVQHGLGSITRGLGVEARQARSFALHTRYGTTGANTIDNAHPFTRKGTEGRVVGVHNGIISNHDMLNVKYNRECTVDSQHIFQHLADGENLNDLTGYGAIVYSLNGEWYIGRFNDGDMHVVRTDAGIFFASTRDAIIEALSFAKVRIKEWVKVKNNTVYRITPSGLTKSYRIHASGTRFRWNDSLISPNSALGTPSASIADDYDWPDEPVRTYENSGRVYQCDYCGAYTDDAYDVVYSKGRINCVCEGCFTELDGESQEEYSSDLQSTESLYSQIAKEYKAN